MNKKHSSPHNRRIAYTLVIYMVLLSSVITLFTSAYQLYGRYEKDLYSITSRLDELEKVNLSTLISSIWISDIQAVNHQLEGLFNIPNVQFVEVMEDGKLLAARGVRATENVIDRSYNLLFDYQGEQRLIGNLHVQATLDAVYQRLIDQAWDIIVSNAIKTFLVTSFMLYLFFNLVTRHLKKMAAFAQTLDSHNLDEKLILDRRTKNNEQADELDIVVDSLSKMQQNLKTSINELEDNKNHYKHLVESSTAIPWELDLKTWQFTYVGPQVKHVLGYEPEEWYEESFWPDHLHPEDRDYAISYCQTKTNSKKDHLFEYRMMSKSGDSKWIRDDVKVICKDNKPAYLQGFMFDITERKNTELELDRYRKELEVLVEERTRELQLTNKELESFSYSVSHDLRSPLRSIHSFTQFLKEDYYDQLDDAGKDYLDRVSRASTSMSELIDALLSLSRVTRRDFQVEEVDLTALANDIFDRQKEFHPDLNFDYSVDENIQASGDKSLLTILLNNLIGNAIKYSAKKKNPVIKVGVTNIDGQDVCFVKDNGAGFDARFVDKIFTPFQRLHDKHEFEGTGVGLATVKRIVDRHNGEIWAESKIDTGSIFYFSLRPKSSVEAA